MKKLAVPVFLVLCALSRCFPGGSGGNTTALFYCKEPGCASNVTIVYCNNKEVPFNSPMDECTGPPPPNTVCQRGGLAFVSTNTSGPCEFENTDYITTQRCTDNPDVCDFTSGTTPSPLNIPESRNQDQGGSRTYYILIAPITVALLLLVGVVLFWWNTRESSEQPQRDLSNQTDCLSSDCGGNLELLERTHTAEHEDSTQMGEI